MSKLSPKEAVLYKALDGKKVMCTACAYYCKIDSGEYWKCWVRKNIDWKLYLMVYWKALWINIDPIEKKPLFHFYPWKPVFSWWTAWCNFHCLYCQNWQMSQLKNVEDAPYVGEDLPPEKIVEFCQQNNVNLLAATYNEPTVFFEYAYDTFKLAKDKYNMKTVFVSNGFETPILWKELDWYLDAINIDLKSFNNQFYEKITWWNVEVVKNNIKYIATQTNIWLEVTTLLIPWHNDSTDELHQMAKWLSDISKDIPWHFTAFHPDWKMLNVPVTPIDKLLEAYEIAKSYWMKFVYIGNVYIPWYEDTYCPKCWEKLIQRSGFKSIQLWDKPWICHKCWEKIPWVWQ